MKNCHIQKFVHCFRYYFLICIRDHSQLFWCLAFPVLLSTLFYFAFGNLTRSEKFNAIPVAIVIQDNIPSDSANAFRKVIDSLSSSSDPFLSPTYATEADAQKMLQENDVSGILILQKDSSVQLRVSSSGDTLQQSILNTFTEEYNMQEAVIVKTAMSHPEKVAAVLKLSDQNPDYITYVNHTGSMDESLSYFYNLIAMFCLYACMTGFSAVLSTQANLSDVGMRNALSPVPRSIVLAGYLTASFFVQYICISVTLLFDFFVLHIDFGSQIPHVLLAVAAGCLTGVCLGFFIGSIGKMNMQVKNAFLMGFIMVCSGLSGLFANNARIYVEHTVPILNRINPSALISDCFFSMVVCSSNKRFYADIRDLLLVAFVFFILGLLNERGKQYESL